MDQVIQDVHPRLKKMVSEEKRFNFLNLNQKSGFRKEECQEIKIDLFDKNPRTLQPDIHLSPKGAQILAQRLFHLAMMLEWKIFD